MLPCYDGDDGEHMHKLAGICKYMNYVAKLAEGSQNMRMTKLGKRHLQMDLSREVVELQG